MNFLYIPGLTLDNDGWWQALVALWNSGCLCSQNFSWWELLARLVAESRCTTWVVVVVDIIVYSRCTLYNLGGDGWYSIVCHICTTCWSVCPSPPPTPPGSWCAPRPPPTASSPPSSSSSRRSTAACGSSPGCLVDEEAPSPVKVLWRLLMRTKMRIVISKPQCLVSRVLPSLPPAQFWGWPFLPDRCPCWPAFY